MNLLREIICESASAHFDKCKWELGMPAKNIKASWMNGKGVLQKLFVVEQEVRISGRWNECGLKINVMSTKRLSDSMEILNEEWIIKQT